MATGIIADVVWLNGLPVNGATVNAYKASRFAGIPAENAAPPAGGADAGPVVSSTTFGGEGAFQITVPTQEPYYLSATYGGVTSWQYYSDTLTSGGGGGGVTLDTNAADIGVETSGVAAAAGATGKAADAGHVHSLPTIPTIDGTNADITASAPGDGKNAGSVGKAADAGHKHARENFGAAGDIGTLTYGAAAAAGSSGKVADAGHVHPTPHDQIQATFQSAGVQVVKNGAGRFYVNAASTILGAIASLGTSPTGASFIVDVNKNGTTIYTTTGNGPTIAAAGNVSATTLVTPDVTALAVGDYLTVDVDQIGSTIAGSDLTVTVFLTTP